MATEPETEIVSDAPVRSRRKVAKKATTTGAEESAVTGVGAVVESTLPAGVATAGEPVVQRLPDEEIRELEVVRIPANPRLVMATCEEDGVKRVVKVWVGINRNFRPRMRLRAQRGSTQNAPWKLVGRRPRLPGRW